MRPQSDNISVVACPQDDAWFRDTGPIVRAFSLFSNRQTPGGMGMASAWQLHIDGHPLPSICKSS